MTTRRTNDPDPARLASWMSEVTLTLASSKDCAELRRLAALDEQPLTPGPHLLARCDGEAVAALSLTSGAVVADPFRRTREVQRVLRCHWGGAVIGADVLDAYHVRSADAGHSTAGLRR